MKALLLDEMCLPLSFLRMNSLQGDSKVLYANRPPVANPQNSQTCLPAVDIVQAFAGLQNFHYTFNALQIQMLRTKS